MTVITEMDDTMSDDDLKEEIMRCFSNAPTMIQVIGMWHSFDDTSHVFPITF